MCLAILKNDGDVFIREDKSFSVGQTVYVVSGGEYSGLFGITTEIRDGEEKETENDTPDIYCYFENPVLPYDIKKLEKDFSELYRTEMTLENIALDMVIMSPDMIVPIGSCMPCCTLEVYDVIEEWSSDGEIGTASHLFTDRIPAKQKLNEILKEDFTRGFVEVWKVKSEFRSESSADYYEAWLDGSWSEYHFKAYIKERKLEISPPTVRKIADYLNSRREK